MAAKHFGVVRQSQHLVHGLEHVSTIPLEKFAAASNKDRITGKYTPINIGNNLILVLHLRNMLLAVDAAFRFQVENHMALGVTGGVETCYVDLATKDPKDLAILHRMRTPSNCINFSTPNHNLRVPLLQRQIGPTMIAMVMGRQNIGDRLPNAKIFPKFLNFLNISNIDKIATLNII